MEPLPFGTPRRCCSSVVEHSLGKGEVDSSILSSSTMISLDFLASPAWIFGPIGTGDVHRRGMLGTTMSCRTPRAVQSEAAQRHAVGLRVRVAQASLDCLNHMV
jgi:hypothetical protein